MADLLEEPVSLAIVVPIHGHLSLAIEALLSARDQSPGRGVYLLAVVDGDADPSLARRLTAFAATVENRCSVYWRRNGGLSAARNTGISIALERFPTLEAVYFLDADNRLGPCAFGIALGRIERNEADILYPDLTNFGLRGAQDTSGRFSLSALLRGNYVEAGSLVSTRVLRWGLRFDETLREGYEDWDFWLRAASAGFRLAHEGTLGLQYRRRPESMLANTGRNAARVRSAVEATNCNLFSPLAYREIAARDEPQFAIVHVDRDRIEIGGDPSLPTECLDIGAGGRRLHLHRAAPAWTHFPAYICFAAGIAVDTLVEYGLLPGLLWRLSADADPGVACSLADAQEKGSHLSRYDGGSAHFVILSRVVVCDMLSRSSFDLGLLIRYTLHHDAHAGQTSIDVRHAVQDIIKYWASMDLAASASIGWTWRQPVASRLPIAIGETSAYPHVPDGQRHIGLVYSAGHEVFTEHLVATAVAFTNAGWVPHLICDTHTLGMDSLRFATTTFIERRRKSVCGSNALPADDFYFGARLLSRDEKLTALQSFVAFDWLDAVMVFAANELMPTLGTLRSSGTTIVAVAGLNSYEGGTNHRDEDPPYIIAAYEHAIDLIWVLSHDMVVLLTALGIPRDKVVQGEFRASIWALVEAIKRKTATSTTKRITGSVDARRLS